MYQVPTTSTVFYFVAETWAMRKMDRVRIRTEYIDMEMDRKDKVDGYSK